MTLSSSQNNYNAFLDAEISELVEQLPNIKHGKLIARSLKVLARLSDRGIDRLDWKILTASLEDLEQGFTNFHPYRHTRKISIFGSARISQSSPEYLMAVDFARRIAELGFMVITGAGGGIMQAGNEGAGKENSFGLNIQLPFEQASNPFIENDPKLIEFKYFFTRKLFFLRESDAIALFPGGFGTQDEAFETLTLCQTGKYGPAPLVLIDRPGGDYWLSWNEHIKEHLVQGGLVCPEDTSLYTITDDLDVACEAIRNFYCVYHSSRYVNEKFVMRLNSELNEEQLELLNSEFGDILVSGTITPSRILPEEVVDGSESLPRLVFHFDRQSLGRLYQMIYRINNLGISCAATEHPERK
jgi:uncharacterized protein (TIGR00730 family)